MKILCKTKFLPMFIGGASILVSFVYLGACSIPYQDATPELYQKYFDELEVAKRWLIGSLILFFAGILYGYIIRKKYEKISR